MRLLALGLLALVLAAPASAASPRLGLFDLDSGLAKASRNVYGDVHLSSSRSALAHRAPGATIARCAAGCRLGHGWLAFAKQPLLTSRAFAGPVRVAPGSKGWSVSVALTPAGRARWRRLAELAGQYKARVGLPPVYAVVLNGTIYAVPLATDIRLRRGTLVLGAFTKAAARIVRSAVDKSLGR
jgi:hypothetical protein